MDFLPFLAHAHHFSIATLVAAKNSGGNEISPDAKT